MATLLMRCSAPRQSWGTESHFTYRDSRRAPSKSGIIGLICAAWDKHCEETIATLRRLKMGVRLDQPGEMMCEFQTAGHDGYLRVNGEVERKTVITSDRFYIADAKFLVGLEGERPLLETLQGVLLKPKRLICLGRMEYPPAEPVWLPDGILDTDLVTALSEYPFLGGYGETRESPELLIEDETGPIVWNDQPISFEPRRFILRRMRSLFVPNPAHEMAS